MSNYSPTSLGFQGWLSPSGELFRVEYWEHDDWAYDYLDKAPWELEQEGWLRIGDSHITNRNDWKFTEHQIVTLNKFGYLFEIYENKYIYEIPDNDDWFINIPYAKGTKQYELKRKLDLDL